VIVRMRLGVNAIHTWPALLFFLFYFFLFYLSGRLELKVARLVSTNNGSLPKTVRTFSCMLYVVSHILVTFEFVHFRFSALLAHRKVYLT
jgi:hypothetical protein